NWRAATAASDCTRLPSGKLLHALLSGETCHNWPFEPRSSVTPKSRGTKTPPALLCAAVNEDDGYFGATVAATYDAASADMFEAGVVDPAVDVLAELAGDGRALEFGIGTGRIALPLAQRGVCVHGIDASEAMVARLRAKPGSDAIDVTIGDFSATRVDGRFSLVYLVFNTIFNLK